MYFLGGIFPIEWKVRVLAGNEDGFERESGGGGVRLRRDAMKETGRPRQYLKKRWFFCEVNVEEESGNRR